MDVCLKMTLILMTMILMEIVSVIVKMLVPVFMEF